MGLSGRTQTVNKRRKQTDLWQREEITVTLRLGLVPEHQVDTDTPSVENNRI